MQAVLSQKIEDGEVVLVCIQPEPDNPVDTHLGHSI